MNEAPPKTEAPSSVRDFYPDFTPDKQRLLFGLSLAEIPPHFIDSTFDNFHTPTPDHESFLKSAKEYADRINSDPNCSLGMILHGAIGGGKTHLAVAILKAIVRATRPGAFLRMVHLAEFFRCQIEGTEAPGDVAAIMGAVPIIVLDDLGCERMTPYMAGKVADLIDTRYVERKVTIITSNFQFPSQFQNGNGIHPGYGERAVSRLSSRCFDATCPSLDFRTERTEPCIPT